MSVPFAAGWGMPSCFRSMSMRVILTPVSQALNLPRRLVDERRHLMDGFALDALALEPVQQHEPQVGGVADAAATAAAARFIVAPAMAAEAVPKAARAEVVAVRMVVGKAHWLASGMFGNV